MKHFAGAAIALVTIVLFFSPASAQTNDKTSETKPGTEKTTLEKPAIKPQDSWTFQSTNEKGPNWHQSHGEMTIIRVSAGGVLASIKEVGSNAPPREQLIEPDWSVIKIINDKETIIIQPLNFPLFDNKSCEVDYTEDHPLNREHSNEHFRYKYVVIGWETISVPAGTFKALKIEADGRWTAEMAPGTNTTAQTRVDDRGSVIVMQNNKATKQTTTGRLYKAFWYVPEVKRPVKAVEEYFSSTGVRSDRSTSELEKYKVTD